MLQFTDQCWDAVTGLIATRISNLGAMWPEECYCYDFLKSRSSSKVREAVAAAGQRHPDGTRVERIVQCSEMFRSEYNKLENSLSIGANPHRGPASMLQTKQLDEDQRLPFACVKLLSREERFDLDPERHCWLRRPFVDDIKIPDLNNLEILDLQQPLTRRWQIGRATDFRLISGYLHSSPGATGESEPHQPSPEPIIAATTGDARSRSARPPFRPNTPPAKNPEPPATKKKKTQNGG